MTCLRISAIHYTIIIMHRELDKSEKSQYKYKYYLLFCSNTGENSGKYQIGKENSDARGSY